MNIKTRFAPSPTGDLHIGSIRTALYSWLFAQKNGGKFLLRIEDSDSLRFVDSAINTIFSGLKWLKLYWDEGPYFQTNRLERYKDVIHHMIQSGIAYKCYCSPERLKLLRITQIQSGEKPKYDGYCRQSIKRMMAVEQNGISTIPYVIRFRNPQEGIVQFHDQVRGLISFHNKELDDLIICRADGFPTYNFCVVVDDMDMKITHVIRGEEHISNTPRQINILKSLKASIPVYAHVSMILNHDGEKLSKRRGTLGILRYRSDGFLPEAILNYLVRLGWSYGDQEIFSIDQMKKYFDFRNIKKSASIFNLKKLLWYNHYYINHLPIDCIVSYLSVYMHENGIDVNDELKLIDIIKLFAKRSYTLRDIVDNFYFFYKDFNILKDKVAQNYLCVADMDLLVLLRGKLSSIVFWTPENIQFIIKNVIDELKIDMNQIGTLLRIVLIGTDRSPTLSGVVHIIGQSCVLDRLDRAISVCKSLL